MKGTRRSGSRRLEELGERALVERLGRLLPADPRWVRVGSGADDTAVLQMDGRQLTLASCDIQVEDLHFRRDWVTPQVLGRRAASVSLSDIAAMGGEARAALASLQLPGQLEVRWFDGIVRGLGERLAAHGAQLVGGNLARSSRGIVVDVTVLGCAPARRIVQRAGARAGDRILTTGWPGESAAGLALLGAGWRPRSSAGGQRAVGGRLRARTGVRLRAADVRHAVRRHLDPTPRLREGRALAAAGVTAMIDISDGLLTDLHRLCAASRVGAEIDADRLPVSAVLARLADALGVQAEGWVLRGGEDYELLCSAPPRRVARLQERLAALGMPLHDVGRVLPQPGLWLRSAGRRRRVTSGGFDHFRGRR